MAHLLAHHLHDGRLAGADQGVRWNIRVRRFVKSYLRWLRPIERYYFLQGQAYFAFASWTLGDVTGDARFHDHARRATRVVRETQREDGAWAYPLPERKHLIATVEGDFGAVTMLEAFERDGDPAWLEAALKWHSYVEREIGYQEHPAGLCVNYFQKPRGLVPNNTCEWIWVLGRFAHATGDNALSRKGAADARIPRGRHAAERRAAVRAGRAVREAHADALPLLPVQRVPVHEARVVRAPTR